MRSILTEAVSQNAMARASEKLGLPPERIEAYLIQADPNEDGRHTAYILSQWVKGVIRLPRDWLWVKSVLRPFDAQVGEPPVRHGSLLDIEKVGGKQRYKDLEDLLHEEWYGEAEVARQEGDFLLVRTGSDDAFRYQTDLGVPQAGMRVGFTPRGLIESYFLYEYAPDSDGANPRFPYRQICWYEWDYGVVYQSADPRELLREIGGMPEEEMVRRVAQAMTSGPPEMDAIMFHKLGEKGEAIKRAIRPAASPGGGYAEAMREYEQWLYSVGPVLDEAVDLIETSPHVRVEPDDQNDRRDGVYTNKVVVHDYLVGQDGTARVNRRIFEKEFGDDENVVVWDTGGYDDQIRVVVGSQNAEIWGVLAGLDDYPALEDTGEAEHDLQQEEWESFEGGEFVKALEDRFVDPLYDLEGDSGGDAYKRVQAAFDAKESDDWYSLAMDVADRINVYWEPTSEGFNLDIEAIANEVGVEEVAAFVGVPELPQLLAQAGEVEESGPNATRRMVRRMVTE
jgi:hypothetical protein